MSKPFFFMHPNGIIEADMNKLKIVAEADVGVMAYFATAILDIFGKLQRGELKDVSASTLKVTVGAKQ